MSVCCLLARHARSAASSRRKGRGYCYGCEFLDLLAMPPPAGLVPALGGEGSSPSNHELILLTLDTG